MILEYDGHQGLVLPDLEIESWLLDNDYPQKILVGSFLIIDTARALFKEGRIRSLKIFFKGIEITLDKNARPQYFPAGFCDYYDEILSRLINW